MTPGDARVNRLVDPIADRKIRPLEAFTTPGVNNVGIGRSDGERADGAGGLIVKKRTPGAAVVVRFPNATVIRGNVKDVGLRCNSVCRHRAAAAKRSNHAPAQSGV